ncbi:RNA-directed DNA polymerase, eukaryota [Tanacetum coccineum]
MYNAPAEDDSQAACSVSTIFADVTTSMNDVGVFEVGSLGGCMTHVVTTGSDPNTVSENKGKMIIMEPDIVSVASLSPTHYNKTIEAIVYRKWTSKRVSNCNGRNGLTDYCCSLVCHSTLQAWDDTIGKLKARLSNWKLKTLSVGGRLTLLKSVLGSTPIYNMSIYKVPKSVLQTMESIRRNFFNGVQCDERKIVWIKWAKVLASKKYGGLGVSSFYALNRALLFKWVWRFISRDNSLWCRLIMSMHGSSLYKLSPFRYSTWKSIIREVHMLKDRGVDLISHCHIRVGNGLRTQFWNEVWIGDTQLRVMFPRIYALEINKDCTVADKLQFSVTSSLRRSVRGGVESSQLALLQTYIEGTLLSNMEDRWVWDLNGEGVFRVKDVRILLDECFLPKAPTATRWVKYVPIKINVFAWKVFLDRLPTRSNLQHRGVLVSDLLCPLCSSAQEDSSHLFFSCRLATDIVRLVCRWWNLSWTPLGSYADWLNWFNSIRLSSKVKDLLEGVLYITWWSVWMFRNQLLFSSKAPRKDVIFDDIVSRSFTWCLSRCNCTFSWDSWLQHPYLISL